MAGKGAPMNQDEHIRWISREILPHERDVRAWLHSHLHRTAGIDVDDVIQEAYSRIWTSDPARIAHPRAYFFRTVKNLAAELLRRARIVSIEAMADVDRLEAAGAGITPERRVSGREEVERLAEAVSRLPSRCRRAFELRKLDGCSQKEIARLMGIAESTVEKHLAKALRLLLREMSTLDEAAPCPPAHTTRRRRLPKTL